MEEDVVHQQVTDFGEARSGEANSKNLNTTWSLHELVGDHPDFEVLCETPNFYCFRYVPNTLGEHQQEPEIQHILDRLNEEIVESVQRIGLNLVTTTRVHNRVGMQISIPSNASLPSNVDATFEAIARWGRLISKKRSVSHRRTPVIEESNVYDADCFHPTVMD